MSENTPSLAKTYPFRSGCPACGQEDVRVLTKLPLQVPPLSEYLRTFYRSPALEAAEDLTDYTCQIAACPRCGTIFHQVLPHPEFLGKFYSALAATEHPSDALDPDREEQRLRELMMVVRFLQPDRPRPRVLDFGTGDGTWARLAAAAGCAAEATDTSEAAFPALRAWGVVCHTPENLPVDRYDLINAEQVFEHLSDPIGVLTQLAGALRPGGVMKIGVPCDPQLREKLRDPDWLAPKYSPRSLNSVAPIEHFNAFTPAGLEQLGRRAGLRPLQVRGWELLDPADPAKKPSWRNSFALSLRRQLKEVHRPPYVMAQTQFFVRPRR